MYTKEQMDEFEKVVKPVIKFVNDNCHPHVTVVITPTHAELLSGEIAIPCTEFLKD